MTIEWSLFSMYFLSSGMSNGFLFDLCCGDCKNLVNFSVCSRAVAGVTVYDTVTRARDEQQHPKAVITFTVALKLLAKTLVQCEHNFLPSLNT